MCITVRISAKGIRLASELVEDAKLLRHERYCWDKPKMYWARSLPGRENSVVCEINAGLLFRFIAVKHGLPERKIRALRQKKVSLVADF
eukprot:IDg21520t1